VTVIMTAANVIPVKPAADLRHHTVIVIASEKSRFSEIEQLMN